MAKFKKGDRVKVISHNIYTDKNLIGKEATVLEEDTMPWLEFDEDIKSITGGITYGYNACGMGKKGYCYVCHDHELELIRSNKRGSIPTLGDIPDLYPYWGTEPDMSDIRPKGTPLQEHNPMYCNCGSTDVVKNMAAGEVFVYCRACKKERL